jgi:spermidine synthase
LRATVFTVGAASLGTEIAAARLLAPYFGASTVIWANTIATVLVALSLGYAVGGRLADRRGDLFGLSAIVMAAAVLLTIVPFVADPFLRLSARALGALSVGAFLGSLVGVLVLVAVPIVLLGAVAPYANRLALGDVAQAGRVTGGLYALSTVGSLVGTFLAALLLIPFAGTHRTFLVFAVALALVAALGLGDRRWWLAPLALLSALAVPPAAVATDVPDARVILSTETPYQSVRVLQLRDGARWLELNEGVAIHSLYRPWSYLTGRYWDDATALPLASARPPTRVAILGDAAGTVARAIGHYLPAVRVDAVELDGELTKIGRRLFGLGERQLHVYTADARPWLAASRARYDAIELDAYRQPYIPFYLVTREFFAIARAHLRPGGVLIVNVGHIPGSDALERAVTATLHTAFADVARDVVSDGNTLLVAGADPGAAARMIARAPRGLAAVARALAARLAPSLRGGPVYTDDLAPVEWLTDLSIVHYATGQR